MSSVLSYGNTCLNTQDIRLLNDGEWLNDKLIGFMFEFFENTLTTKTNSKVIYVSPEVTQFIKLAQEPQEVGLFLEPLNAKESEIIIFAVNNHNSGSTSGGTHWSLLIFDNNTGIYHHYDSAGKLNENNAICLMKKSYRHINAKLNRQQQFKSHLDCTQQRNSYDCGMYVIFFVEVFCRRLKTYSESIFLSLSVNDIFLKRKYMRDLIQELHEEARR